MAKSTIIPVNPVATDGTARPGWFDEQATDLVDAIREYTYRPGHDAGWHFDMDRDEAINFVSAILLATSMRRRP
jgi:hypothetical protein